MNISSPTYTLITAGSGLVGVLIGSLIARWNGIVFIKRQEFNKSASVFYTAFLDDIIIVEDSKPEEISIKLLERASKERSLKESSAIETTGLKHRKAMIIFRPYIDKSNLSGFDDAWSKYSEWPKHYGDEKNKGHSYDFKARLYRLLEYAEPK